MSSHDRRPGIPKPDARGVSVERYAESGMTRGDLGAAMSFNSIDAIAFDVTVLAGRTTQHLGPLDDSDLILVIGRNNPQRPSASLNKLLLDLRSHNFSVVWFETPSLEISRILDWIIQQIMAGQLADLCLRLGFAGRLIRKIVKSIILIGYPSRWRFFFRWTSNRKIAAELIEFIDALPMKSITVFSHSAGGIVASLAASHEAITKIVCFGYPFRHPENNEEPSRTEHLRSMPKPLLIFQGDNDAYGNIDTVNRYALSPKIEVVSLCSDHDYNDVDDSNYKKCLASLTQFLNP